MGFDKQEMKRGGRCCRAFKKVSTVDANLDSHREHFHDKPGLKNESGYLGFQSHTGRIEFRNIKVRPLNK